MAHLRRKGCFANGQRTAPNCYGGFQSTEAGVNPPFPKAKYSYSAGGLVVLAGRTRVLCASMFSRERSSGNSLTRLEKRVPTWKKPNGSHPLGAIAREQRLRLAKTKSIRLINLARSIASTASPVRKFGTGIWILITNPAIMTGKAGAPRRSSLITFLCYR